MERAERETAEEQIRRLIETYGDMLLRMCCLQLGDRTLAEDAAQDAFFKAWQHLDGFRGECSEKTWLMRIAVNTCRDYRRRAWFSRVERRTPVEELPLSCGAPSVEDDAVLRAVTHLPAKEREVVLLRYYQEMKLNEIGEALGVPEGTVTSRLNRARGRLRARLKGWYFDEELS